MRALEIADQAIDQKLSDLRRAEQDLLGTLALADGAAETDKQHAHGRLRKDEAQRCRGSL